MKRKESPPSSHSQSASLAHLFSAASGGGSSCRSQIMELGGGGRKKGGRGTERPGPWPPVIEPFVPRNTDLNPRELKSWARRTGFNPNLSGETSLSSLSEREVHERNGEPLREAFLQDSASRSPAAAIPAPPRPREEIRQMLGRGAGIGPVPSREKGFRPVGGDDGETQEHAGEIWRSDRRIGAEAAVGLGEEGRGLPAKPEIASKVDASQNKGNGNRVLNGRARSPENTEKNKEESGKPSMDEENGGVFSEYEELEGPPPARPPQGLKCGLTENPGLRQYNKILSPLCPVASRPSLIIIFPILFLSWCISTCSLPRHIRPSALPISCGVARVRPSDHGARHGRHRCKLPARRVRRNHGYGDHSPRHCCSDDG